MTERNEKRCTQDTLFSGKICGKSAFMTCVVREIRGCSLLRIVTNNCRILPAEILLLSYASLSTSPRRRYGMCGSSCFTPVHWSIGRCLLLTPQRCLTSRQLPRILRNCFPQEDLENDRPRCHDILCNLAVLTMRSTSAASLRARPEFADRKGYHTHFQN